MAEDLIEPSLLEGLTEAQREEALAAAAAAKRAEDRAEQRALERAMERKLRERELERRPVAAAAATASVSMPASATTAPPKVKFLSKRERERLAKERQTGATNGSTHINGSSSTSASTNGVPLQHGKNHPRSSDAARSTTATATHTPTPTATHLTAAQIKSIKQSYLGKASMTDEAELQKKELAAQQKQRKQKKITFKFEWDASEDTSQDVFGGLGGLDPEPLYEKGGRGRRPPSSSHHSRDGHHNNRNNRQYAPSADDNDGRVRKRSKMTPQDRLMRHDSVATVDSVTTKPLAKMTPRDWRIFRENFDIIVKGGKAPPPLRSFREPPTGVVPIHPILIDAIENTLGYKDPSPIQRQAIPIGLQRRDLVALAETGSGKTAAFGIPLLHHILLLPDKILATVNDNGPLALVMAPTRELALQIDAEIEKLLSRQKNVKTLAVVGGQPIQAQAFKLREGVHVVVGTPGRINECVEMAYMVLNQCSYIVLDEADKMIDMGFAPQIEQILDAMGGLLKSEDETETYRQEREDLEKLGEVVPRHRLTAMFSATMPSEVERIAKRYLRHPVIVKIGDQDSGKNTRIVQKILFLSSPAQKENALKGLLRQSRRDDKIIVFVNEKKHADGVGRMVERAGFAAVVLHGGKTQEQREENLGAFRRGGGVVLVATDVAGRGLDIPNVTHVINYDIPSRSIDNYCHRIGRTGRAGKEGFATTLLTDADEGIFAALKVYLESTGSAVPDRLARHPAAAARGISGGNINT